MVEKVMVMVIAMMVAMDKSGDGTGALSSEQAGVIQEWTNDAFRLAFEGLEEGSALVEKPKKADKAGTGADSSSKSASAKAIPAIQGEFLTPADSIYDKDLGIFYGQLPSWNEIQDLLQYPTPPQGLYKSVSLPFLT